jgi:hypothetical protein
MNKMVKEIWDRFVEEGEKVNSVDEMKSMREQRNEREREWDL